MVNPSNQHEKESNKSLKNNNDSGSNYHKQHAGHVEGYGEPYPTATNSNDATEKTE